MKEATTALVQCISRGGRPAPTVSWTRNGALLEEEADTRVSVLGDLSLITVSTLTFPVTADMEGDELRCETYQVETGDRQSVTTTINIQQRYIDHLQIFSIEIFWFHF